MQVNSINFYSCSGCGRKPQVTFGLIPPWPAKFEMPAIESYCKKQTSFSTRATKAVQNFFVMVKDKAKAVFKK